MSTMEELETEVEKLKNEVAKQSRTQIAKWIIGTAFAAVAGVVVLIGAGAWGFASPIVDEFILERAGIPKGAIVAFLSSATEPCPSERWELYEAGIGRMIVGAGHPGDRSDLTPKKVKDVGGSEVHTLRPAELPSHDHGLGTIGTQGTTLNHVAGGSLKLDIQVRSSNFNATASAVNGENEPHNNMPPWVALYFCQKV